MSDHTRIIALETWKAAHLVNHVTTGHPTTATGVHGLPAAAHPADALTEAQVKTLLLLAQGGGGGTTPPTPPADTTPPVISNVVVTAINQTSAVVSWTTNEPATGQVEYGTTTGYGSTTTLDSSLSLSKSQSISGLTAGTPYYYRVLASDAAANAGTKTGTFTTVAVLAVPSVPRSLVAAPGNTLVTLNWTAPSSTGGSAITGYHVYRNGSSLVTLGVVLAYSNTGLTNTVAYSYTLAAINATGEGPQTAAVSATPSATDTTAPVISGVSVIEISQTSAKVVWSLSEPATGQVEYGLTNAYGSVTTAETSTNYSAHAQVISGLTAGTTYHYWVHSVDASGNGAYSTDRTFATLANVGVPPPATGRPFAAPTTTQTRSVPASINATGGSDVSADLNAWIATVPDGSIISFPPGGIYRLSLGIQFRDRHNLVFVGNGATLRSVFSANPAQYQSPFLLGKTYGGAFGGLNTDISISGFTLEGDYPTPGAYSGARENQAGVSVNFSQRVEISNITVRNLGGDAVMCVASPDVWIHNISATNTGRMGVAVISGTRILIEQNTFGDMGYYVLDIEPNDNTESCTFITFRNNVCQSWGPDVGYGGGFVAALSGTVYLAGDDIEISGNAMTGSGAGNKPATLVTYFNQNQHRRLNRIKFINNTSVQAAGAGGVIQFKDVDGLTVYGNTSAGVAAPTNIVNCTNVDTTP